MAGNRRAIRGWPLRLNRPLRRALGAQLNFVAWGWILGLGLAGTMALGVAPARAQVDFAPPATFTTGAAPYAVALGDLDGDAAGHWC